MLVLILILHLFLGSTLAGIAVVAVLTAGYGTLTPIVSAAALGFFAAFPVSRSIARRLWEAQ